MEVLVGRTVAKPIYWNFYHHESYASWLNFFSHFREPKTIVCDGQKGMLSAIKDVWPEARIQRCLVHIHRLVRIRLTRHPKTEAGTAIKQLVDDLFLVKTRRQKRRWLKRYVKWRRKYQNFINQKSTGISLLTGRKTWWYTHKNLRSVKSLVTNALPDLFTFVGRYDQIPRTSNHVEGGINSRLKELVRRHRGLKIEQKQVLTATFLKSKSE